MAQGAFLTQRVFPTWPSAHGGRIHCQRLVRKVPRNGTQRYAQRRFSRPPSRASSSEACVLRRQGGEAAPRALRAPSGAIKQSIRVSSAVPRRFRSAVDLIGRRRGALLLQSQRRPGADSFLGRRRCSTSPTSGVARARNRVKQPIRRWVAQCRKRSLSAHAIDRGHRALDSPPRPGSAPPAQRFRTGLAVRSLAIHLTAIHVRSSVEKFRQMGCAVAGERP
jgi:hypothetical protein